MRNTIAILIIFALGALGLTAGERDDVFSQIDEWSAAGECDAVMMMSGWIFELGRLGQDPVYVSSDGSHVFVSTDSRMRGRFRSILPAKGDASGDFEAFLDSVIVKARDPLKRRGVAQLKEVVGRGHLAQYDSVVFYLVFGKEYAAAYELNYSPDIAHSKLLESVLKDELSANDLKVLEKIALDPEVEAYTSYSAVSILLDATNDSKKYGSILDQAQQRMIDAYTNNSEPEDPFAEEAP